MVAPTSIATRCFSPSSGRASASESVTTARSHTPAGARRFGHLAGRNEHAVTTPSSSGATTYPEASRGRPSVPCAKRISTTADAE